MDWQSQLPKYHPLYRAPVEQFTHAVRVTAIKSLEAALVGLTGQPALRVGRVLHALRVQNDIGEVERLLSAAIRQSAVGESRNNLDYAWTVLFRRNLPR